MDPSKYKDLTVTNRLNYHYYYSPASPKKPTLLFLHGFPSSSHDWIRQIKHFQPQGYGILAPDLLGYGGTSKPKDLNYFRMTSMAADVLEILDAECLNKVVGIGHDWGSALLSRLAILYPEHFHGFAFLALYYVPPTTTVFSLEAVMAQLKESIGNEMLGYWQYLDREDSAEKICQNIDSFVQLVFPKDPEFWQSWICPAGKTAEWIEANKQPGRPSYLSEEEYTMIRHNLLASGLSSAQNWYRVIIRNSNLEDNRKIPESSYKLRKPAFFAAALKDALGNAAQGKAIMNQYSNDLRVVEFDVGHWVQFEATEKLNKELDTWIEYLMSRPPTQRY